MTHKQSCISQQPEKLGWVCHKAQEKRKRGKRRIRNNDKSMLFVWQQTSRNTSEGIQGNWVSMFAFPSRVSYARIAAGWRWDCYVLSQFEFKRVYDKLSVCFRVFMLHSTPYTDTRYGSLATWEMRADFSQQMNNPVFCSEASTRFLLITGPRGYKLNQTA